MKQGQRVAIWLHDAAAKALLRIEEKRPSSRWVAIGRVVSGPAWPIGVWLRLERMEEKRPVSGRTPKRVVWPFPRPPVAYLIPWGWVITAQLLAEAEQPQEPSPGQYL